MPRRWDWAKPVPQGLFFLQNCYGSVQAAASGSSRRLASVLQR